MVDLGEEERGLQAEGGHGVTVGLRHARDDSLEAQPPEIVGHPPGGVLLQTQAEQASDSRPKIPMAEAVGDMEEAAESLE